MTLSRLIVLPISGILLLAVSACGPSSESIESVSVVSADPVATGVALESDLSANQAALKVNEIADLYYVNALANTPEIAYFSGIEPERHDGMHDNSPAARQAAEAQSDSMLDALEAINPDSLSGQPEWITYAYLMQALQSEVATRVCRSYWWDVSQMDGWHSNYVSLAQLQPVGTAELRAQSLTRWAKLAGYIDQDIENLQSGLQAGYSAPKSVVQRVVNQVDGLLALELEASPFYSPATRDTDEAFDQATRLLVAEQILPAIVRYRDFLAGEYMSAARSELSVTANPNGRACYEASIRSYTTLDRSGEQVYELGLATVEANKAEVIELGKAAYGLDDFVAIMGTAKADAGDRFSSKEELLEFSRQRVKSAEQEMPNWVTVMPKQPVEVIPFEEHEEGTGRAAHYRTASKDHPAEYRIPLFEPETQSRGAAESTAFHETWPGHHLQTAIGQSVEGLHPIAQIIWFSGPGEGWARYTEGLAEEMGLYTTTTGPILRRAWPARGMAVDPGIHLMGWTREQAKEYMLEAGRFPEAQGDDMVDRIAILPGQLTAYDSGGLEILALRRQAEEVLGDNFDIREFHYQVLKNGTIPLTALRTHIENWISSKSDT